MRFIDLIVNVSEDGVDRSTPSWLGEALKSAPFMKTSKVTCSNASSNHDELQNRLFGLFYGLLLVRAPKSSDPQDICNALYLIGFKVIIVNHSSQNQYQCSNVRITMTADQKENLCAMKP